MVRMHGTAADTARLESIAWRKPALVEIVLSQYEDPQKTASIPNLSDFTDLKAVYVGSRVEVRDGVRRRFFTFRMGKNIPQSPTDRSPKDDHVSQWSMNTTLNQLDIQRHPNFPIMRKKYNGSVVREVVVWPTFIQDPDSKEKKVIKNPMFGVRSFLAPEVEVSVERGYMAGVSMDFRQVDEVGYADTPTGFAFFAIPVKNAWAAWVCVENSFRVAGIDRLERKVWRSSYEGWAKEVYNAPGIQGVGA